MKKWFESRKNTKKQSQINQEQEMKNLKEKSRFTEAEIKDWKHRFSRIASGTDKKLNKTQFRQNMGLLGLDTAFYLADKIFAMLDEDDDEKVEFKDFLLYLDVLFNGSQDEKNELSFRLIDQKKQGWFDMEDFSSMMKTIVNVWSSISGSHLSEAAQNKVDYFIDSIFNQMDEINTNRVDLNAYKKALKKNPNLLEIFDFLNRGITEQMQQENTSNTKDQVILKQLGIIDRNLQSVILNLQGDRLNIDMLSRLGSRAIMKSSVLKSNADSNGEQNQNVAQEMPYFFQNMMLEISSPRKNKRIKTEKISSGFHMISPKKSSYKDSKKNFDSGEMSFHTSNFHFHKKEANDGDDDKGSKDTGPQTKISVSKYISPIAFDQAEQIFGLNFDETNENVQVNKGVTDENTDDHENKKKLKPAKTLKIQTGKEKDNSFSRTHRIARTVTNTSMNKDFKDFEEKVTRINSNQQLPNNNTAGSGNNINEERKSDEEGFEKNFTNFILDEYKEKTLNTIKQLKEIQDYCHIMKSGLEDKGVNQKVEEMIEKTDEIKIKKLRTVTAANVYRSMTRKSFHSKVTEKFKQKKKNLVFFGHQNWNLVLNMMIGIQTAVKSLVLMKNYMLSDRDFSLKYYFELIPKRTNQASSITVCRFYDYCPYVFYEIRRLYGIRNDEYLKSIGPETMISNLIKGNLNTLQELVSTGKSGSFFYYTADGRFTLKTIHYVEYKLLKNLMQKYFSYLEKHPDSLLIKFYGLHKIKYKLGGFQMEQKLYVIIMANVFYTDKEIHERYDIKGSLYKRRTHDPDPSVARKDQDLLGNHFNLKLTVSQAELLQNIIDRDSRFLAANNIIDYSLLIGVHYTYKNNIKVNPSDPEEKQSATFHTNSFKFQTLKEEKIWPSNDGTAVYFLGIIDILTLFNAKKKLEYLFKCMIHGKKISAIPPKPYSNRFVNFVRKNVVVGYDLPE